jgi:hypothetical protein
MIRQTAKSSFQYSSLLQRKTAAAVDTTLIGYSYLVFALLAAIPFVRRKK